MTGMNSIGDLLDQCVDRHRDLPALIWGYGDGRRVMSFGELGAASARLAGGLIARGVRRGDAVLVLQSMSPNLYLVLIALFRMGAVALFPDPQALRPTISAACRQFRPKAVIGAPAAHALRLVMPELRCVPVHVSTGIALPLTPSIAALSNGATASPSVCTPPESPALITFTSGSTGAPKAVPRSHLLLLNQHAAMRAHMPLEAGSTCLVTLPVLVLSNLLEGVTSILPSSDVRKPGSVDPGPLLAQIGENDAQAMIVSPALLERLVMAGEPESTNLAHVKQIFTGGGPVFPDLIESIGLRAPQARLHIAYGSSEAEPVAHIVADEISEEDRASMAAGGGLLAGRPVPPVRIAIVRTGHDGPQPDVTLSAFEGLRCAPGERGEICVTGDHVVKTYADPAQNVETKIRVDGQIWHRTGDAGYLDDQGRLWLSGRWNARIPHDGDWLYPFEVEAVARNFLSRRRLACVEIAGRPALAVQGKMDFGTQRLLEGALHPLGVGKIVTLRRLPMDRRHNSKIDYPALQRHLAWKHG
ncbi:MAG: AMP-binding protein [Alphaproteobacteria bacterium]